MPVSEKRLKAVIKQELKKRQDEKKKRGHENPVEAARSLMEKTDMFLNEIQSELNTAGKVMRPGIKKAFENYLNKKLDQI